MKTTLTIRAEREIGDGLVRHSGFERTSTFSARTEDGVGETVEAMVIGECFSGALLKGWVEPDLLAHVLVGALLFIKSHLPDGFDLHALVDEANKMHSASEETQKSVREKIDKMTKAGRAPTVDEVEQFITEAIGQEEGPDDE